MIIHAQRTDAQARETKRCKAIQELLVDLYRAEENLADENCWNWSEKRELRYLVERADACGVSVPDPDDKWLYPR